MNKWICRTASSTIVAIGAVTLPVSALATVQKYQHHPAHAEVFGTPDNQDMPFGCKKRCNAANHVNYLRSYFPYFYDIVTQNSPRSNANRGIDIKGIMAFSGEVNMDMVYTNRRGTLGLPGSAYGVGVRPLFNVTQHDILGNINNVNLFIDTAVNDWVLAHVDLAYVNASRKGYTYAHYEVDWGSVYHFEASLKVNQAYLLFSNPAITPLYIKVGRFNATFGDYEPFAMISSLTQLLTEARTGGVIAGAAFDNGLYGSVSYMLSKESLERFNAVEYLGGTDSGDPNYGAKLGFRQQFNDNWFLHVNAAYMSDMRNADYLLEGVTNYNVAQRRFPSIDFLLRNTWVRLQRAAGMSLHGELDYTNYGITVDYVKALSGLNGNFKQQPNSMIAAWNLGAHACFPVFCCPTRLDLSYQGSCDPDVYESFVQFIDDRGKLPFTPFQQGNVLPCNRLSASYHIQIMPYVGFAMQWVHDSDWDKRRGGTDRGSDMGVLRLHAEF